MTMPRDEELLATRAFITRLHIASEADRSALRAELHDDLGGLMVSTAMDLFSVSQLVSLPDSVQEKIVRAKATLQKAIDLSRSMQERLRPSILDNMGLFAASRHSSRVHQDISGCRADFFA